MNILIVENNSVDLRQLLFLLEQWGQKERQSFEFRTFSSGESCIASGLFDWPDVCFLDIQLSANTSSIASSITSCNISGVTANGINGIETAKILRQRGYQKPILFLTAFREYVFDGYKVHALDYLLKPLSYETLASCMREIERMFRKDTYLFQNGSELIRLSYSDIISIHSAHHLVELTTPTSVYTQRTTLEDIQCHLPSEFVRCHRTCIVNMAHIVSFSHSEIRLSNMTKMNIGRTYLQNVIQKFSDYTQHLCDL